MYATSSHQYHHQQHICSSHCQFFNFMYIRPEEVTFVIYMHIILFIIDHPNIPCVLFHSLFCNSNLVSNQGLNKQDCPPQSKPDTDVDRNGTPKDKQVHLPASVSAVSSCKVLYRLQMENCLRTIAPLQIRNHIKIS